MLIFRKIFRECEWSLKVMQLHVQKLTIETLEQGVK